MSLYSLSEQEIRLIQKYRDLARCEQLVVFATTLTLAKRHAKRPTLPAGVIDINAKRA